jgi:hypothetical protein
MRLLRTVWWAFTITALGACAVVGAPDSSPPAPSSTSTEHEATSSAVPEDTYFFYGDLLPISDEIIDDVVSSKAWPCAFLSFQTLNGVFGNAANFEIDDYLPGVFCSWRDRINDQWNRSEVTLLVHDRSTDRYLDSQYAALEERYLEVVGGGAGDSFQPHMQIRPNDLVHAGWIDGSGLMVRNSLLVDGEVAMGAHADYYVRIFGRWFQISVSGLAATAGSQAVGEVGVAADELRDLEAKLYSISRAISKGIAEDLVYRFPASDS